MQSSTSTGGTGWSVACARSRNNSGGNSIADQSQRRPHSCVDAVTRPDTPTVVTSFVLCGVALRIIFWTGPIGSDDVRYFDFAAKFLSFRPFSELDIAVRLVFLGVIGTPA